MWKAPLPPLSSTVVIQFILVVLFLNWGSVSLCPYFSFQQFTSNILPVEDCALLFCVRPLCCLCCCRCRTPACPAPPHCPCPLTALPASPCPCYCAKLRAVATVPLNPRFPTWKQRKLIGKPAGVYIIVNIIVYCPLFYCPVTSRNK